ncbi:hypothetical protein [Demequina sp. NBRC 110054]|uniref:hypothetical protein n=1 Tax=Demequina sp. NBRC 110054 TaxID=1570343 RepID=UPI001F43CCF4|nr:hypothetical protein [Demequina sp. NBRC 110054]
MSRDRPTVARAAAALREAARALEANAADQERASAVEGATGSAVAGTGYDSDLAELEAQHELKGGIRGVETTVTMLSTLSEHGGDDIGIITFVNADGTRSHIVMIPGTQDLENSQSDTVFNSGSWLPAGQGEQTELEHRVLEAMREHGIESGEPVQMAGYSLGGLVSANIAAHNAGEFSITSVVTVGSYSPLELPDGVSQLQVIDSGDPMATVGTVVGLQQATNRADVVLHVDNPGFNADFGYAITQSPTEMLSEAGIQKLLDGAQAQATHQHQLDSYVGNMLGAAREGTLDGWNASTGEFASGEGVTTEMYRYKIRDF